MNRYLIILMTMQVFLMFQNLQVHGQLFKLGDRFLEENDYINSIAAYNDDVTIAKTNDEIGYANMQIGTCYYFLDKYDSSLLFYFKALNLYEKSNNIQKLKAVTFNISRIYYYRKELSKTEKYLDLAYQYCYKTADKKDLYAILSQKGIILHEKGKSKEAIEIYHRILNEYSQTFPEVLSIRYTNNIGGFYDGLNNDSALAYYLKAEKLSYQLKDSGLLYTIYCNIGEKLFQKKKFKEALNYLNKSYYSSEIEYDSSQMATTASTLAVVYDSLHQYKEASKFLRQTLEIRTAIFNVEKTKIESELDTKYESGKKDEKIKSQEIENKLKSRNLLLSLAGLALVAALAILSFINYQRKQKANKILKSQNEKIEALNKELDASNQVKTKLFSVISHDLRSPISSLYAYLQIKNKAADTTDKAIIDQTEQLLETLEDLLVWSKSQLHQFVPSIESVNLHRLCNDAISLLKSVATTKELQVVNAIPENLSINSDQNILTIVVRNLLANAAKYALPKTAIAIEAVQSDAIQLIVSNETGIENASLLTSLIDMPVTSSKSGMGMMLIKEFVEKLKGNFSYTVHSNKVVATISLPA